MAPAGIWHRDARVAASLPQSFPGRNFHGGVVAVQRALLGRGAITIAMEQGQEQAYPGYMTVGTDGKIIVFEAGDALSWLAADRAIE